MLQDLNFPGVQKGKHSQRKESNERDGCFSSSRYSSQVFQESPSNSVGDVPKT